MSRRLFPLIAALAAASVFTVDAAEKKTRDQLVNEDRDALADSTEWIYNDLDAAKAAARKSGKPLFVALRCIP